MSIRTTYQVDIARLRVAFAITGTAVHLVRSQGNATYRTSFQNPNPRGCLTKPLASAPTTLKWKKALWTGTVTREPGEFSSWVSWISMANRIWNYSLFVCLQGGWDPLESSGTSRKLSETADNPVARTMFVYELLIDTRNATRIQRFVGKSHW